MNNVVGLIILYLAIAFFTDWPPFKQEWTGYVYPKSSNILTSINVGIYDSYEDCEDAAIARLYNMEAGEAGSFECGLNCKYDSVYDLNICKETKP